MKPIINGRKLLVILSVGVLIVFYLFLRIFGEESVWGALDIPTWHPSFIDLRGVLSGLDAARLGVDPIYENPLDPYGRPVVYPRLWLALGALGLSENNTEPLAYSILVLYAISILVGLKGYNRQTSFWLVAIIFSPAAMLCYKFANLDLVIFILIAIMLALDKLPFYLGFGLLELAAFLKYFPIVGLGYLLKEDRKRFFRLLLIGIGIFVAYLAVTWRDTSWIVGHTPRGALENYGVGVISFRVYEITNSRLIGNLVIIPLFIFLYLSMIFILYLVSRYKGNLAVGDTRFIDAFRIGALIYLATFIQGNSFNYRLIFLIFTVPQIVIWAQTQADLHIAAYGTIALLVASCWGMVLTQLMPINLAFALDEIANWALFGALLYLFMVSSPDWIRLEIVSFFSKYGRKKYVVG
jgi:hypothetical protein